MLRMRFDKMDTYGVTKEQPTSMIQLTVNCRVRDRPQICGVQVIRRNYL